MNKYIEKMKELFLSKISQPDWDELEPFLEKFQESDLKNLWEVIEESPEFSELFTRFFFSKREAIQRGDYEAWSKIVEEEKNILSTCKE